MNNWPRIDLKFLVGAQYAMLMFLNESKQLGVTQGVVRVTLFSVNGQVERDLEFFAGFQFDNNYRSIGYANAKLGLCGCYGYPDSA